MALDLPEPVREAIAAWRDALTAGREELRPVAAAQLHVTLAFLGWQDKEAAKEIARVAFDAAAGMPSPVLQPAGLRALPPRAPRLFALDLEDERGRCVALQAAISAALEAEGAYHPEKRPFWPHVTLARVRRGARVSPLLDSPPPGTPFEARELTLYRSTLRPQGALYEPLARMQLDGG